MTTWLLFFGHLLFLLHACPVLNPAWNSTEKVIPWTDVDEVIIISDLFALNDISRCPSGPDQCTVLNKECTQPDPYADNIKHVLHPNNSFSVKVGTNPNSLYNNVCFKCCKGTTCITKNQVYRVQEHMCKTDMAIYSNWTMPISFPYSTSSPVILTADRLLNFTSANCTTASLPRMETRTSNFCAATATTGSVLHVSDTQMSISTDVTSGWSTTLCIQFSLSLSTGCCGITPISKQIYFVHFAQQPQSGPLCQLSFKRITHSATYSVPAIADMDNWTTIYNVADWLDFRDTCTPQQVTSMKVYRDLLTNFTEFETDSVRIQRDMADATKDGVLQVNSRTRKPYTNLQAVIDINGNTVNIKGIGLQIRCKLDVDLNSINRLNFNRLVSKNYPDTTLIDFSSFIMSTSSNQKECPKTNEFYVSQIGDLSFTVSATYALANTTQMQQAGQLLMLNAAVPFAKQFKVVTRDPDFSVISGNITINQVCGSFAFSTTQTLFTSGPVVAFVPLDESLTKITAAILEWSNESNDVSCGPSVVILYPNDTAYDVAANDFLSVNGKQIQVNPRKLQMQMIKFTLTDVHSMVYLSPIISIEVMCKPHSKNETAQTNYITNLETNTQVVWWEAASISTVWPKTSNEVVCPRFAEFYKDGVLIAQTKADETRGEWVDSGLRLMIHPGKEMKAVFEIKMRYTFETYFKSHSVEIEIKNPVKCSNKSFAMYDPAAKITGVVASGSQKVVLRTKHQIRSMFRGPDCPCEPQFRIEQHQERIYQGSSIKINSTSKDLEIQPTRAESLELNLVAYFAGDCQSVQTQTVPILVEICGPVNASDSPVVKKIVVGQQDKLEVAIPLHQIESMFSPLSKACIMNFTVSQPTLNSAVNFDPQIGLVIILKELKNFKSAISIEVSALTMGNFTVTQKLIIEFILPLVSAPTFQDPLGMLMLMVDQQKVARSSSSVFEYKSPKAIDFQQDSIKMSELKIEPTPPCGCFDLTINPDQTFNISFDVQKLSLKDSRTYNVSILLSDFSASTRFHMVVQLKIQNAISTSQMKLANGTLIQPKVYTQSEAQIGTTIPQNIHDFEAEELISNSIYSNWQSLLRSDSVRFNLQNKKKDSQPAVIKSSKPVILRIAEISGNGKMKVEFNQNLQVPGFLSNAASKRFLLEADKVLEANIFVNSMEQPQNIRFTLEITDWDHIGMELFINFTNPLAVSSGPIQDRILLKVLNSSLFTSLDEREVLQNNRIYLQKDIPKQLPPGVDEESLQRGAEAAADSLKSLVIVQIVCQLLLKSALDDLMLMYFTLQMICYLKIYAVAIPANLEIYMVQFTKLVEFDILNPESFIQMIIKDKDFRLIDWILGNDKFELPDTPTIKNDLRFWIIGSFLFLIFSVIVLLISLNRKYTEKIKKVCVYFKNMMVFNGLIDTVTVMYLQLCMSDSKQIQLKLHGHQIEIGLNVFLLFLMLCFPAVCWLVIVYYKQRLEEPTIKAKISILYQDTHPLSRNNCQLAYFPIFLLRRIVFVLIPTSMTFYPAHQIQTLLFLNLLYIMFYIGSRPHIVRQRRLIEIVNELLMMTTCYHIVCFSDFNQQQMGQYSMGFGVIGILLTVVVFNMGVVCLKTTQSLKVRRMLKNKKGQIKNQLIAMRERSSTKSLPQVVPPSESVIDSAIISRSCSVSIDEDRPIYAGKLKRQVHSSKLPLNLQQMQELEIQNTKKKTNISKTHFLKPPRSDQTLVSLQFKSQQKEEGVKFKAWYFNSNYKVKVKNVNKLFKDKNSEGISYPVESQRSNDFRSVNSLPATITQIKLSMPSLEKTEQRPKVSLEKYRADWLRGKSELVKINIKRREPLRKPNTTINLNEK